MRARIIIPVLALGLLLAAAAWLLRPGRADLAVGENATVGGASHPTLADRPGTLPDSPKPVVTKAPAPAFHPLVDTNTPGMESPTQREQDYVEQRVAELMDLGMDDQPASLQTILGELNNREPEIRQAAVQASMQFGSRDAIPRLRDAMDQTDDLKEKMAIQEAIEFLQTPSALEVVATHGKAAPTANAHPAPPRR